MERGLCPSALPLFAAFALAFSRRALRGRRVAPHGGGNSAIGGRVPHRASATAPKGRQTIWWVGDELWRLDHGTACVFRAAAPAIDSRRADSEYRQRDLESAEFRGIAGGIAPRGTRPRRYRRKYAPGLSGKAEGASSRQAYAHARGQV